MSHEYDVFLSYNRDDQVDVEHIKNILEVKYHIRAWLDTWNLVAGQAWMEDIEDALDKCATFAILIGPRGIGGWNNEEMRAVIDIRSRDKSRRVIPVYLPGAPDEKSLPTFLKILSPIDFRHGKGLEDQNLLFQLHKAIKGLERGETLPDNLTDAELEERLNTGVPDGSYFPFVQNAYFTGRTEVLERLEKGIFNPNGNLPIILSGMGGLGKTQTAVEFAYRYAYRFRGVHWINLDTPDLLETKLEAEIARCGRHMGIALDKQEEQVAETLMRWKNDGPRLVVLDNLEQINEAHTVFSRLAHANIRILVTSRRMDWHPDMKLELLALNLFQPQEAVRFLRAYLGNDEVDQGLFILAEKLGYLPLALELAASYIRVAEISVSDYLMDLASILEHDSMQAEIFNSLEVQTSTKHILDLQATFALSWQKVTNTVHQDLFRMAGYLAPNVPIPVVIFERALEQKGLAIKVALRRLFGLGLLNQTENSEPAIHPLLAEYARGLAKENAQILEKVATVIEALSDEVLGHGLPFRFIPLRPHMLMLAAHAEEAKLASTGGLWINYGYYLQQVADYPGARVACERGIKMFETSLGSEHPYVALGVNNLGLVLKELGDLNGARAAYQRAIKISEATLGLEHPQVAAGLNNLGLVLRDLGDFEGARAAYERAIKIGEASLGSEHPQVALGVNNLGLVLRDLGDLNGARAAYERAIKISEANFGSEHPQVALGLNNLGDVLRMLGDLPAARAALERALKVDEATLGPDHPNVGRDSGNLGDVLRMLGDLPAARAAVERALSIHESAYGPDHPYIASGMNKLGRVLQDLGDLNGACIALQRALKIDEATLGSDHPNIARDVKNLGGVLQDLGDREGAHNAYERALKILKQSLPPDHPDIKIAQSNLDSLK